MNLVEMIDILKDLSLAALGCLAIWYACARSKYLSQQELCDCEMCKSLRVEERA